MMEEGFHKMLHAFMAEKHYSQKEAAAALGVSRTTLLNWLNGCTPNGKNMLGALNVMMVSVSDRNDGHELMIDDEDWKYLSIRDKKELKEDAHRRAVLNRLLQKGE
ncbi:MAG: helix-turn-helix domain-containing protein [Bacilli bacterium]|nr:helix-turn-helix domain-containing protein [Bacilli bacterium]